MTMIKGMTVTLYEKAEEGTDEFNNPVYDENPIEIENVLVSPSTTEEVKDSTNLYGKKAVYTVAIPKSDDHVWEDRRMSFFGRDWHSFGFEIEGIEDNIPLDWNRKVYVERYG